MTKEQIKEQLSLHYVGAIISRAGHQTVLPHNDVGIDLVIRETIQYFLNDKKRFMTSGNVIDVQLKCTTENSIERIKDNSGNRFLKYDLEVKNYNDLIIRRQVHINQRFEPLLLILVVLSEKEEDWLRLEFDEENQQYKLSMSGVAYWFFPDEKWQLSSNSSRKRITIPVENRVDENFLSKFFN